MDYSYLGLLNRYSPLLTPLLILIGMTFVFRAYSQWRDDQLRRDDRHYDEQLRQRKREESQAAARASGAPDVGPTAGGYIVLNLPDDQKALFHDVLKGFEEYAGIKGYSIQFSIDNSSPNQIAFKFTVAEAGIQVSSQQVRNDFDEYMEKIRSGDPLIDLPIVIPEVQHRTLLLAMQNRINFLHHTYTAQANVVQYYERFLRDLRATGTMGVVPAQNYYIQTGGAMLPTNYSSVNSQNVAQGTNNSASNNTIDHSIKIGGSFNERKTQLDALDRAIRTIAKSDELPSEEAGRAVANFQKVKDELAHEEKPDAPRIQKWLEAAKLAVSALTTSKEVVDAAKDTFSAFGIGS
ncbi:hypothetical protein [Paraburkholderia unamae]|uniref:Uncharacterized protein n=1 Tax=Paraburkholderia unamae TaxID=219649 RepID=A0ACC6RUL8_9BURK